MALTSSARWLLLCVGAVALCRTALCRRRYPVCDIRCCSVLPSCAAALRVACNCTRRQSMTLRKGDVPTSVLSIRIWNAKNVVVYNDAITDLKLLTNFSLRGIDQVEIKGNGMVLGKESRIRSVTFQDIGNFQIERNAFSGFWETRTSVRISDISKISMESNAFGYESTSLGPSLVIERIKNFRANAKGFMAPLYYLRLDNVFMNTCEGQSFGGRIHRIELNKLTIGEAKSTCFSDLSSLSSFSIQHSKIAIVRPGAFSGRIRELSVMNSNFTTIYERGIDIQTYNMKIVQSHIKQLSAKGLSATAKDSIKLEDIRVDFLGKNALAGLRVKRGPDGLSQPLDVRRLDVLTAEPGSLVFADCADVRLDQLNLVAPWPRVCPTERWVRELTGAAPSGPLNPIQFEVLMQLFGRHLCSEDIRMSFPERQRSWRCELQAYRAGYRTDGSHRENKEERDKHPTLLGDSFEGRPADAPRGPGAGERRIDSVDSATGTNIAGDARRKSSTEKPAPNSVPEQTSNKTGVGRFNETKEQVVEHVIVDTQQNNASTSGESTKPQEPDVQQMQKTTKAAPSDVPASRMATLPDHVAPSVAVGPAPTPAQSSPGRWSPAGDRHQLLLYQSLGITVGTALAAVLVVALLLVLMVVLVWRRRSDRRQTALQQARAEPQPGLDGNKGEVCQLQRVSAASSSLYHQYEPIREDLLLPVPPPPPSSDYGGSCASSQLYERLLDR